MARFIAGDWGTTHLRLFLCDGEGRVLGSAAGPGAVAVRGEFANTFDSLTSNWIQEAGELPAILCGMVGSSIGWSQTAYVPCPIEPVKLANACVPLRDGRIHLVPGITCRNRLSAPDLMRGEETQVLGALQLQPALRSGRHLLCLPGTHTKWAVIEEGSITDFLTSPTGELFATLCKHSVLVATDALSVSDNVAFERGLTEFARYPHAQLLHRIFECRSRWLTGDLEARSTASYLSGLLIASDVRGALDLFADVSANPIHVIGSNALTHLYAQSFTAANHEAHRIDGEAAARAGLTQLYLLLQGSSSHAR
jgi:2-dehydro-3-deoxygalactonokinase